MSGRRVDAVTVPVPDLDAGLRFYGQALGHLLKWRNDSVGQAGLELPDGDSELVLTTAPMTNSSPPTAILYQRAGIEGNA